VIIEKYTSASVTALQTTLLLFAFIALLCKKRSFTSFSVQTIFWWLLGCTGQAVFNIYFIIKKDDDPAFGDNSSSWIVKMLFWASINLYFCIFWQFCVHYYKQVDALGNDKFWLPQE